MQQVASLSGGITCHQLEAPELNPPTETTLSITAESTFQLPFGEYSALSQLRSGEISSVETLLLSVLNYRSNWESGKTWRSSYRELSKLTGISTRYLRDTFSNLLDTDWISLLSRGNKGSRYQVKHHNCESSETPTDKNGNPLKFAVPRGINGILEKLFSQEITWKSCIIWIMLKLHSDWKTGITQGITIDTLRKWVGMSPQTVSDCLDELAQAGLLKRTNGNDEAGIYQLYPKPNNKPKPIFRKQQAADTDEPRTMRADGVYRYSFNEKYRINIETTLIEKRSGYGRGPFKAISDHHYVAEMPKAIKEAFEMVLSVQSGLFGEIQELAVTDSTHPVTDSTHPVTDTAQGLFSNSV